MIVLQVHMFIPCSLQGQLELLPPTNTHNTHFIKETSSHHGINDNPFIFLMYCVPLVG